ncbi:response regulator transcription factor [Thiotrichales bacterium 19S3-7]|nr:response regulator transcription factor [Thiotrichales bacterium 19S3-7]MCF6802628.1 response regulator transcription factor [Thiotrichales bacterium 19S3-11]
MNKFSYKILMVEDDQGIIEIVVDFLNDKLIDVDYTTLAKPAFAKLSSNSYDAAILDLNLPDMYGIDLCKEIQKVNPKLPILILSSNAGDLNRIVGLEAGALDYMEKPFNLQELYIRLRKLIDLNQTPQDKLFSKLQFLSYIFDRTNDSLVDMDNRKIELTKGEAKVLELLLLNHNKLQSRYDMAEILGLSSDPQSRTIDQIVSRVRNKINDKNAQIIQTIRGHGYIFVGKVHKL